MAYQEIPPSGGSDPGVRNTAGSDVQFLDFTVAGATDGGYVLEAQLLLGTGGDLDILLQLNSVATGYTTAGGYSVGVTWAGCANTGNFGGGANTAGVAIARGGGNANRERIQMIVTIGPSTAGNVRVSNIAWAESTSGVPSEMFHTQSTFVAAAALSTIRITTSTGGATAIKSASFGVIQKRNLTA